MKKSRSSESRSASSCRHGEVDHLRSKADSHARSMPAPLGIRDVQPLPRVRAQRCATERSVEILLEAPPHVGVGATCGMNAGSLALPWSVKKRRR